MATVTAFLQHSTIGKASQAEPYTASAHARYITRRNAASLIYSERMPRQYHALQRYLNDHEDHLRRNGRILDKFIISVPHDISEADAAAALKRFGYRLGQGKTPFLFALHGFDTRNHHAHFIFIDRDIETGRRVFGTSERGSSATIKIEWETAANATFAELGYDVRVQVKEGYQVEADNDNEVALDEEEALDEVTVPDMDAPLSTDTEIDHELTEVTLDALTEDVSEDEFDMTVIDRIHDDNISLAGNDARLLASTVTELNRLNDAKTRMLEAQERYAYLTNERVNAEIKAGVYEVESLPILQAAYDAEEKLGQHMTKSGKLKGFGLRIFGKELKTPARRTAEAVKTTAEIRIAAATRAEHTRREYRHQVEVVSARATAAEREAFMRQNELRSNYGTDRDLELAESTFNATITKTIQGLTLEAVQQAYQGEEITPDEYEAYLVASGNEIALEEFRERQQDGGIEL